MDVTTIITACHQRAKAQKLSLAQVANKIGVDRSLVGHWFNARRTPSADKLFALMNTVGLQLQFVDEPSSKETNTAMVQAEENAASARITNSTSKPKPKRSSVRNKSIEPIAHKKTSPAKEIKPIRSAPAFENLTPAEIETARKLFGLELSGNA